MPIKGLTDRAARFPQIGTIRKGEKKTREDRPGKDLPWFRPVFDEEEQEAAEVFFQAYGPEPREINIYLPSDEVEECFEAYKEAYKASGLMHRCDGEYVLYAVNPNSGEILVRNGFSTVDYEDAERGISVRVGDRVKCTGSQDCKDMGRLFVLITELARGATMCVTTTSKWDIIHLDEQLRVIKQFNGGRLVGIPLVLRRRVKSISTPRGKREPGQSARVRRNKSLLSIEQNPRSITHAIEAKEATGRRLLETQGQQMPVVITEAIERARILEDREMALPYVPRSRGRDDLFKETRAPHEVVAAEKAADNDAVEGEVVLVETEPCCPRYTPKE